MSLLLLFLTTGCGTVVYRVNPDSPPQMSASEAMEAVELSLTISDQSKNIESLKVDEDFFDFSYPPPGGRAIHHRLTVSYDNIAHEVFKTGNRYAVNAVFRSPGIPGTIKLSWKSEEDARNFVDAAYVLRKKSSRDKHREKAPPTATAEKASPKTVMIPPPASAPSSPVPSEKIAAVQKPPVEKIPPKITIISPDVTRSVQVVARQSRITVTGVAESKIGITEVTVNGLQAELDESGNFSAEVPLKVGRNTIVVAAVDLLKNKTENRFNLQRMGGKVSHVKKEDFAPEPGIPAASYHALFVAVEDYESKDIGKLDYAVSDARRLRDILVSNYTFEKENTILLENPNRKTIYKTLQGLRSKLTEKDNLLIFYAGHGYWLDDMKQGFWLPRDASGINDPSDWIPNSNIRDYIKAIKAKHILLVADACFSGGMFKVRDAFPGRQISIEKIYEQPSRKAITSGSLKTVPDRSVFLEFLAKRLRENNEMYLDAQKLFTSLREAVINNSPIHQTPLYGAIGETGDEGGDFIFIKRQ